MIWLFGFLVVALLVCLSPLFERIWELMPFRISIRTTRYLAWGSLALVGLATAWALLQAVTFTLGAQVTPGAALLRCGIFLLGAGGCWYVWTAIQRSKTST